MRVTLRHENDLEGSLLVDVSPSEVEAVVSLVRSYGVYDSLGERDFHHIVGCQFTDIDDSFEIVWS